MKPLSAKPKAAGSNPVGKNISNSFLKIIKDAES